METEREWLFSHETTNTCKVVHQIGIHTKKFPDSKRRSNQNGRLRVPGNWFGRLPIYSGRWENPGERWVCVCICICIFNCICICILVSICIWCGGLSILQHWKMLAKSGSVSVFVFEFTRVSIFRTLYGLAGCPYFGRWENPGERWVCLVKKYSGHSRKILAKGWSVCFQLVHNEYKVCLRGKSGSVFYRRLKVCRPFGGYLGILVIFWSSGKVLAKAGSVLDKNARN